MTSSLASIRQAWQAAPVLRATGDEQLKQLLRQLATAIENHTPALLEANARDVARQDAGHPRTDRLRLTPQRIQSIADAVRQVSALPNPANRVVESRHLPSDLYLEKKLVPLGVVGAIYESRPNVTFDIAALCIRSGNACVLKGSSEADHTNQEAVALIHRVLAQNDLPEAIVTLLPAARESVNDLFTATRYVDVLIPRGSDGLIRYVRENSLVPTIETGAGVCHVYVHEMADPEMAARIVVNAKVSRPSVCNAMDVLLVDTAMAARLLPLLSTGLAAHQVEVFADPAAYELLHQLSYPWLQRAAATDYDREFLDYKCAIRVVAGMEEALLHISEHGTRHSEAIVTESEAVADRFLQTVDAAAVYHNASTRFTDGEVFGLGAEIGISTQKLHARGPFALEKLVTEKWILRGKGTIRE